MSLLSIIYCRGNGVIFQRRGLEENKGVILTIRGGFRDPPDSTVNEQNTLCKILFLGAGPNTEM